MHYHHFTVTTIAATATTEPLTTPPLHHTIYITQQLWLGDHCEHCKYRKDRAPTTRRSSSGFALPSATHNNQSILPNSYCWNFRHRLVRYHWYWSSREKMPRSKFRPKRGHMLCASLRSTCKSHLTRAILYQHFSEKLHGPGCAQSTSCASP